MPTQTSAQITTLVTALAAGADAAQKNLATPTIQNAHTGLKALLAQRGENNSDWQAALRNVELHPGSARATATLVEQLQSAAPQFPASDADHQLLALAEKQIRRINEQKAMIDGAVTRHRGAPRGDDTENLQEKGIGEERQHPAPLDPLRVGELHKQTTAMDPHLRRLAARDEPTAKSAAEPSEGQSRAAAGAEQVDLTGELKDPGISVPGLHIVRRLGTLFTATAAASDITTIAEHDNVVSLQVARPLRPTLAVSIPEIGATPAQLRAHLPQGAEVPDGRGVIVGIVDYGCNVVHKNFRHADGTTRILALWHQDGSTGHGQSPAGFPHGREYRADAINAALQTEDPWGALSYRPDENSHGTHVMDIAAGNGRGTGSPGVAPAADLIFVHIGGDGTGVGLPQEQSFGNARNLIEAVDYIFHKAAELGRPAVVNISLGTHGGPHDGSTPAERWFDELLKTPDRAIVVSAGNSWRLRAHTMGSVRPDAPVTLPWLVRVDDPTDNEVEIWYGGKHCLHVVLLGPDGTFRAEVPRGHSRSICNSTGKEVISIIHNEFDAHNGDHQISILLDKSLAAATPLPDGATQRTWEIELHACAGGGDEDVPFHAWIERDDVEDENSSFFQPNIVSTSHTLGSISCGEYTIAVGAYLAGQPNTEISAFSSQGPTRDGKEKPEVSAPGQHVAEPEEQAGVLAAGSGTHGTTRKAGTSMAAPHVTGLIALLLQSADGPLPIGEIRARLFAAVRREPPEGNDWDPFYGFGRVDAKSLLTQRDG